MEARKQSKGGISKGVLGLVLVLLVALGGFLTGRRGEERRRVAARSVPAAALPAPTPEQQALEAAATKALVVLPVEQEVFQKFHATWGAAQERLRVSGVRVHPAGPVRAGGARGHHRAGVRSQRNHPVLAVTAVRGGRGGT